MALFRAAHTKSSSGGFKSVSPLQRSREDKKPEKIKKTAEELAIEHRQSMLLDDEIEEGEERFKALARNQKGRQSLLSGQKKGVGGLKPRTATRAGGGGSGGGSMLNTVNPSTAKAK